MRLKLVDTPKTSFQHEGQTFKVIDAPASVFDAFISQVYEEITDVDRQWDIYDRWDILNDALEHGDLLLVSSTGGMLLLEIVDIPVEKTTEPEELSTERPELQTSGI